MNIKCDYKKVTKGDTFISLKNNEESHQNVLNAIKNGATKVVVSSGNYDVETIIVSDTKKYLIDYLYDNYYEKIKKLKLIGITGTNGKTTTSLLMHNLLNKLGRKCAYVGTNGFYIDKFIRKLPNTTPGVLDIYELLLEAILNDCEYVCLEASSHGLDQNRLANLKFDFAIFSNLTHEHLGYHKTMENYALAKQKLFNMLRDDKYAIINIDDLSYDKFVLDGNNNIFYGFNESDYTIVDYKITFTGNEFTIKHENSNYLFKTKLIGKHNIYNALVSIIILHKIGYSFDKIKEVLEIVQGPSGRMEMINYKNNNIIVDYAHTPDGIKNVLESVKKLSPNKIITVIGCGGGTGADREKRKEMGNLVLSLSDYVIFTNDNPRDEEPMQIINDLLKEKISDNYSIELDREKAIEYGINELKEKDILMILGKGHEDYQIIGNNTFYFNDKETVLKIIGGDGK